MLGGCSSPRRAPVERLAFLPFENLSGDASLDWVAAAAPSIAAGQIAGLSGVFPFRAGTLSDAYRAKPTRFVHGYFTRRGEGLHFEIEVEDAARHKMVATATADGGVLDAMNTVARRLNPAAHPFSTSNPGAIEAWGRGDYSHAVALDPDFGPAWVDFVGHLMGEGQTSLAAETAAKAISQSGLRSDADRARLDLLSALLHKDDEGRRKALTVLSRLVATDVETVRALAEIEVNSRRFAAGAELYRNVLRLAPDDETARNELGYAEAFAGDLAAAKKDFEEYSRQPNQQANGFDSLGEGYFMNGRFAEAEKSFLDAHGRDAAMLGGGDLLKAAYAHWLGGDLKGADAIMRRYLDFRGNLHDPLLGWREAVWLYATGRSGQAVAKLQVNPGGSAPIAERQLAIWKGTIPVPKDLAALKNTYDHTPPATDGEVRTFYAAALEESGQDDEARKLISRWPIPEAGGDPLFQSLVLPRFLELRSKLGIK